MNNTCFARFYLIRPWIIVISTYCTNGTNKYFFVFLLMKNAWDFMYNLNNFARLIFSKFTIHLLQYFFYQIQMHFEHIWEMYSLKTGRIYCKLTHSLPLTTSSICKQLGSWIGVTWPLIQIQDVWHSDIFTNFQRYSSTLKTKADKTFSIQQFIW